MVELQPLTCSGSATITAPGRGRLAARRAPTSPASATAVRWRTKSRTEPRGSRRDQSAASSASRERLTSRSAVSGWRRTAGGGAGRPARSAGGRRRRRASARARSAAARWSAGRPGSGRAPRAGAAGSRARPRARRPCRACAGGRSWSPCARSTERSSTGGRVSARTTAAASDGSASIRSQASTSRTSGRSKNAASPAKRKGTLRSSSAAATSRPSRQPEPAITQIRSGADLARGQAGARPRAPPPGPGRARSRSARSARRLARLRRDSPLAQERVDRGSGRARRRRQRPPRASRPPCTARAAAARRGTADRLGGRARRRGCPSGATRPSSRRPWARPASSSSSAITCRTARHRLGDVRALAQQAAELEHQVAAVEAAGLGEDPVVAGVELGELDLALGPLALGRADRRAVARERPLAQGSGRHRLGLEQVDRGAAGAPAGRPGCRGSRGGEAAARRRGRAGSPAGRRPDGGEERVEAGLGRVLAQQALGRSRIGADPELLVRRSSSGLGALAKRAARGARAGRRRARARRARRPDRACEAHGERLGAPGARGAQRRAAGPRRARRPAAAPRAQLAVRAHDSPCQLERYADPLRGAPPTRPHARSRLARCDAASRSRPIAPLFDAEPTIAGRTGLRRASARAATARWSSTARARTLSSPSSRRFTPTGRATSSRSPRSAARSPSATRRPTGAS